MEAVVGNGDLRADLEPPRLQLAPRRTPQVAGEETLYGSQEALRFRMVPEGEERT